MIKHFSSYNATQSQTNSTILCPPRSHKTFVWNIFASYSTTGISITQNVLRRGCLVEFISLLFVWARACVCVCVCTFFN